MKKIGIMIAAALAVISAYCSPVKSPIAARNGFMEVEENVLPSGARYVEYLESTGTQYIDTMVNVSPDIGVYIDFQFSNERREQMLFGALSAGIARYYPVWRGLDTLYWSSSLNGSLEGIYAPNDSNRHTITHNFLNDRKATIDGVVKGTNIKTPSVSVQVSNFLYARHYSSMAYISSAKIFECNISIGSNVVRKFRPIAIGNVGYMLDLVSGEYLQYGNKGTGDFIIGPDI